MPMFPGQVNLTRYNFLGALAEVVNGELPTTSVYTPATSFASCNVLAD